MKINGRSIKRRLALWSNRLSRTKHFRGHGVHSPFAYGLVRKVFMRHTLFEGDTALYDALIVAGLPRRRAIQLHNARLYCEATTYSIDTLDGEFAVLTPSYPSEQLAAAYDEAHARGTILVIVSPYANRERQEASRAIITRHTSTTVDNRAYLIVMNNHLPKQHFRL